MTCNSGKVGVDTAVIDRYKGMVYSAVGCTPAFMVAAAGSIPAFSTCPFFRAGSALDREC